MWWFIYWFSRLDKKKKAKINPKNTDNKCFQYAATVAQSFEQIESHPERVSNIKPFITKYNWKGINYPTKIDDLKTFENNFLTIALNILYLNEEEIHPAYIWKINSKCEKKNFLLMIPNEENKVALSCSKKTVYIIKRSNIKTWWFLLFKLSSFL